MALFIDVGNISRMLAYSIFRWLSAIKDYQTILCMGMFAKYISAMKLDKKSDNPPNAVVK